MKRIRYHSYGYPSALRLEDAPAPTPGPGDLLVRVGAIGVTLPSVRQVRSGPADRLPGVPGGEVSGEVFEIGGGGDRFRGRAARHRAKSERLWSLARSGSLRVAVDAVYPLAEAAEAHRRIEARANRGKVVLHP